MIIHHWEWDEAEEYRTLFALNTETGLNQRIGVPIYPDHQSGGPWEWVDAGVASGRMGVARLYTQEADGRAHLRVVGAAPFDVGEGAYSALSDAPRRFISASPASWGFFVLTYSGVTRVSVPPSGAVAYNEYALPAWVDVGTDPGTVGTIDCVAGTRVLVLTATHIKISNVLATHTTAWTEAASVPIPSLTPPETEDEDRELAAALTFAVVELVRGLGDEVVAVPVVYRAWDGGLAIDENQLCASVGDQLLVGEAVEDVDGGWVVLDTNLVSRRYQVSGGVASLLETKTASMLALTGSPWIDYWRIYGTAFSNEITNFWTGFKLAAETP